MRGKLVAISFSMRDDFPEMIRKGIKDQTIRPFNEKRFEQIKRIRKLQLYWKQRTKECYKIADAELTEIFKIRLYAKGTRIGYIQIWDENLKRWRKAGDEEWWDAIKRDGFSNAIQFYDAFHKTYGDAVYDMEFMVIRFKVVETKHKQDITKIKREVLIP